MKKGILVGIGFALLFVSLISVLAASDKVPKYWQDIILKPEQAWIEAYGYNNESILAYNVRSLIRIAQQQEKVIAVLKKELDVVNINKIIPTWPDYIELPKTLLIEYGYDKGLPEYSFSQPKGTRVYFKDPNEVKE